MLKLTKSIIKKLWPAGLDVFRLYRDVAADRNSYLHRTGWLRTAEVGKPVSADGFGVPWINYPMIDVISRKLDPSAVVFEFGSGNSTAFFARIAKWVDSLEYDQNWFDLVQPGLPSNAHLLYQAKDEDGEYCRRIKTTKKTYDLVLVDGRDRVNCVKQSLDCLTPRGVVVLDDSDRERYQVAFEILKEAGFSELTLVGMKPGSARAEHTTVFYRAGNVLGL